MKRETLTLLGLLFTLAGVSAFGQVAPAPSLLNFQGRLAHPDGTPVADGNYSVRFSLWTAMTGGTEKWNQTVNPVTVRKGTFSVLLNVGSPADLFSANLWMEIKIGTAAPLTPRRQVVSVAFAMKANTVPDNAITSAKIADGAITSTDIANGTITGADIANGTITADKLASGATGWMLGGNAGTNPASQFLGTTDNQPLVFRTNNTENMRIQTNGKVGIGTNVPDSQMHIVGGPTWTLNGWARSLAINNAAAFELGYGLDAPRFGLGASGGNLYLFTAPSEGTVDPASYRLVVNGNNGYMGIGTTTPAFPVTLSTPSGGYGFVQTYGPIEVGTWTGLGGGWFGTRSDHPLYFFTNDGLPALAIYNYETEVRGTLTSTGYIYARDGVTGVSTNATGVEGTSDTWTGVIGLSNSYIGVSGYAVNGGYGVWAGNGSASGWGLYSDGWAGGTTAWQQASDVRYKQNIATFDNALDAILNLRGVSFDWKRDTPGMNFAEGRQIGFVAQEVEKVLPELVHTDKEGYKSVAYANVVPVLVEAVKTLKAQKDTEMKALRDENTELKAQLEALKAAVRQLQAQQNRP